MKIIGKIKLKLVACLTACFCLFTCCGILSSMTSSAKAEPQPNNSSAYFVTEDRYTQGLWYSGEDGFKEDTPEQTAAKRNYGKRLSSR